MTNDRDHRPRKAPAAPTRSRVLQRTEEARKKRMDPAMTCIIVAMVTVILFGALGLILLFGSGGIGSIAVGGVQARESGIWFEIRTTGKGLRSFTGEVGIEIMIEDKTNIEGWRTLLRTTTRVKDDYGVKEVPYSQFLQGNGDYRISVGTGDVSSQAPLLISNLVTSLDVDWSTFMPDPTRPEYYVMVDITYMAGSQSPRNTRYPSQFFFDGRVIGPDEVVSVDPSNTGLYSIQKAIEHVRRGNYSLVATLTNLDCAEGSQGRNVEAVNNVLFNFDAPPFANAGDDQIVDLVDGSAMVTLDASGSWDDGGIVEYIWDFDDGTSDVQSKALVRHTYAQPGNYTVSLSVKDDRGQSSVQDAIVSTVVITVEE